MNSITIETLPKTTKPDLIDFAHASGWLRTKTEGKALSKEALVCLVGEKLSALQVPAEAAAEVETVQEARPVSTSPLAALQAAAYRQEKNTKPPLTFNEREAKRKRNKKKLRRQTHQSNWH